MAPTTEVQALFRCRKKPIVLLALLALLVAQAAAGVHALQHFGRHGDAPVLPGQHGQVTCLS